MIAAEANIWDRADGEDGWIRPLDAVLSMLDLGDIRVELETAAASFAAMAVYLIRDHLHESGRVQQAGDYQAAVTGIAHLLPAATPEQISDQAAGLHNSRGFPVDARVLGHQWWG